MKAPLVTTLVLLAAWLSCLLTSTLSGWHPAFTRPATSVCALGLLASVVWLSRTAGRQS